MVGRRPGFSRQAVPLAPAEQSEDDPVEHLSRISALVDHAVPGGLEHADGPLEPLASGPFFLRSSLIVLLRIAHDPTSLVGEIEPYTLLVIPVGCNGTTNYSV